MTVSAPAAGRLHGAGCVVADQRADVDDRALGEDPNMCC